VDEELKTKLQAAHRILHTEGFADDWNPGHLSARGDEGRFYITPWGAFFRDVPARDFQAFDIDGCLLESEGSAHPELMLDVEIYRRRPDVFSITHLHPFYSILFSSLFKGKIALIGQHAIHFSGVLPFYQSAEPIQSRAAAGRLARTLGDRPVIVMKNHGITVVGKSVEESVILAMHFEQAAKAHLIAASCGTPAGMPADRARKLSANNYNSSNLGMLWRYYLKKAREEMPCGMRVSAAC
jgi:ribulose-5-phosphate 4-epimerase/fuculose-1-phosphate aldolase